MCRGPGGRGRVRTRGPLLLESRLLSGSTLARADIYEMRKMHKRRLIQTRINTEQPDPRQLFPESVCLLVYPSIYLSTCPPSLYCYLCVHLPTQLLVYLYVSVCLAACLSLYLPSLCLAASHHGH